MKKLFLLGLVLIIPILLTGCLWSNAPWPPWDDQPPIDDTQYQYDDGLDIQYLDAPTGMHLDANYVLTWNPVHGASSFMLSINGEVEANIVATPLALEMEHVFQNTPRPITIGLQAARYFMLDRPTILSAWSYLTV